MAGGNAITLKDAINKLLDSYKLRSGVNQIKIEEKWEEWMGRTIARHTRKIYIKNSVLFVHLDNAPLKQELSYSKAQMIAHINEKAGQELIKDVVIG